MSQDNDKLERCLQSVQRQYDHLRQAPEGKDPNFCDDKLLGEEFDKLCNEARALLDDPKYARLSGQLDVNTRKNRYRDILPYDSSIVKLKRLERDKIGDSSYINASFIKGASGENEYIASQGPLLKTVNDFWRMIWEHKVKVIVMACNEVDGGKKKCERYWPKELNAAEEFGLISVVMVSEDKRDNGDYVIRRLRATKDSEILSIKQCHYTAWPDHGIPRSMDPILDLLSRVRKFEEKSPPPMIIHCSAGCGRTGTLIALDYVRQMLVQGKLGENLDVYEMCIQFRKQRMAFIQAEDQYEMVHRGIIRLLEDFISHSTTHLYENIKITRKPSKKEIRSLENLSALADSIIDNPISEDVPSPLIPTVTRDAASIPTRKPRPLQGPLYHNVTLPSKIINDEISGKSIIQIGSEDLPSPTKPAIPAKPSKTLPNPNRSNVEYALADPMSKPLVTSLENSGCKSLGRTPTVYEEGGDDELEYSLSHILQSKVDERNDELEYALAGEVTPKLVTKPVHENKDALYASAISRSQKLTASSRSKFEAEKWSKNSNAVQSSIPPPLPPPCGKSLASTSTMFSSPEEAYSYADPQSADKHHLQGIARGYEPVEFQDHITRKFPVANNDSLVEQDSIYSQPGDDDRDPAPKVPLKTKGAYTDSASHSDNVSIKSDEKPFSQSKSIKAFMSDMKDKITRKGPTKDQGHLTADVYEFVGDTVSYKGKNIAMPNRVGNLAGVKSMPANLKSVKAPYRNYKP